MGKDINNETFVKNAHFQKCRMAYSLNNWQPVQCTLLSEQPFFYMDEEEFDIDENEFLEKHDNQFLGNILSEIEVLQEKINVYDTMSSAQKPPHEGTLDNFIQESNFLLKSKQDKKEISLREIKAILLKSRMAGQLYAFAQEKNIVIQQSKQVEKAFYDQKAGKIFIHPQLNLEDQVLLLVQELRRHWQNAQGAMVNPLSLHPDEAILLNRAQKADLSVAVIRCAWEMKLQGYDNIWLRIEKSSFADLGRALAQEALMDFRTLNNGKASSAVFETWFLSERCSHTDRNLIQSMLADYRGYVFETDGLSQMALLDLICKLGKQPFGKNYLASYAQMIINDTLFTEVRDRSNANFLWFIKFERAFQETEQELQSSAPIKMAGVDLLNNKNIIEDNQDEGEFTNAADGSFSREVFVETQGLRCDNIIEIQFGKGARRT